MILDGPSIIIRQIMQAKIKSPNEDIHVIFNNNYEPNPKTLQIMKRRSIDQYVWISYGAWKQFHFKEACQNVDIWSVDTGLGLSFNNNPQLITELCGINFTQLKILNLSHNHIFSLEWMHKLNLPSLVFLDLSNNEIVCLKGMRKGQFAKLQKINLNSNPVNKDLQYLTEMKAEKLSQLAISPGLDSISQKSRLPQLIKVETNKLQILKRLRNPVVKA